jgi:hypothetical protein
MPGGVSPAEPARAGAHDDTKVAGMNERTLESTAPAPRAFREFATIEEGCAELGEFLGLSGPVSSDVFYSAMQDATYARNLIISRSAPAFIKVLLDNPPLRFIEPSRSAADRPAVELLAQAAKSLWAWSRSGLQKVSDETYRDRLAACGACPHHQAPPDRALYAIAAKVAGNGDDRGICGLCGCLTANKARMASEACPDADPARAGFTRWGEPKT